MIETPWFLWLTETSCLLLASSFVCTGEISVNSLFVKKVLANWN